MYNLNFINDEDLFNHIKNTVEKYRFTVNLKQFNKNLIDPIKMTFDSKIYHKNIKEIIDLECIRQIDKTASNHIGYFHQNIFKYIYHKDTKQSNWEVPREGFDIINEKEKIFVEMKNKHNTMNASSSQKTYIKMLDTINKIPNSTCMLVEVIAKHSQNIPWIITLDKQKIKNEHIRRVSIDKFYEIVTGEKTAFKELVEKIPIVLDDVIKDLKENPIKNTVFEELKKFDENILKSLYLLSFKKYEGFEELDI